MWKNLNDSRNYTFPKLFPFQVVFPLFDNITFPILVIFAFICWLVNISLLITIFIDRLHCLKKGSGWFVASMSVASIIAAVAVTLTAIQLVPLHKFENPLSLTYISQVASFGFILIVTAERCALTITPIRYKVFMTEKNTKVVTLMTWILSIGCGVLQYWIYFEHTKIYTYSSFPYIGLILFVAVVDGLTFYKLKQSSIALRRMTDTATQRAASARIRLEKRFAYVVLLLLVNFVLFACPVYVWGYLIRLNMSCRGCLFTSELPVSTILTVLLLLLEFHSTNIALLYLVLVPKYRQSFKANWKAFISYFTAN